MSAPTLLRLSTGEQLAYHHVPGAAPGVLFCGGYTSDMSGTKALALEAHCRARGRAFTRFDYRGHGASGGRFADGTIGELARRCAGGGRSGHARARSWSSARAWAAGSCCCWRSRGRSASGRWSGSPRRRTSARTCCCRARRPTSAAQLAEQGYWLQPSAYGEEPYPVTARLLEDGPPATWCCARPIPLRCPVHLLHGQRDPDVPWQTALRLAERLESDDVTVELIKAGDHRLSTPSDLARITGAIERLAGADGAGGLVRTPVPERPA